MPEIYIGWDAYRKLERMRQSGEQASETLERIVNDLHNAHNRKPEVIEVPQEGGDPIKIQQ